MAIRYLLSEQVFADAKLPGANNFQEKRIQLETEIDQLSVRRKMAESVLEGLKSFRLKIKTPEIQEWINLYITKIQKSQLN